MIKFIRRKRIFDRPSVNERTEKHTKVIWRIAWLIEEVSRKCRSTNMML